MNHDATHCSDFTEECPMECFRAQLARDLSKEALWFAHLGVIVSFAHLKGTKECALVKEGSGTDLIRREDAIQAVANDCDGLEPEQALQYARDLISGCPTQGDEHNLWKWVPISERLPKKSGWYLVSLKDAIEPTACVLKFEIENGRFWDGYDSYEVTAWMPKPTPYKGENK